MIASCLNCAKYDRCGGLCRWAERYVSKDEVKMRELPVGIVCYGGSVERKPTATEEKILTLLRKRFDRDEICKIIGISRHSLRQHLTNLGAKGLNP